MTTRTGTSLIQNTVTFFTRITQGVANQYGDAIDRERARLVNVIAPAFTIGLLVSIPYNLLTGTDYPHVIAVIGAVLFYMAYRLVRAGQLRFAAFLTIGAMWMIAVTNFVLNYYTVAAGFGVSILLASLMLGTGWSVLIWFFTTVAVLINIYLVSNVFIDPSLPENFFDAESILRVTGTLLFVAVFAEGAAATLLRVTESSTRQARQLEAAAVISETAATSESLNALLNVVVERIRESYGFYHAQVFLLDPERRMARLEASTGRAGRALLGKGHALAVGSQSIVGQCTARRIPIVVNDVLESETHRPNELLPDTRAELALPLMIGGLVIGALDVQSTYANVFQPEDIRTLQIMSGQLATAIDKARLLDELQARASENERLFEESQSNLEQIRELSRRLTREGWTDYLNSRRSAQGMGYTLHDQQVRRDQEWTAAMRQAYQGESSVVVRQDRNAHIAAIPLSIRGEVVGVLEIQRDGERPWTDAELEMAETLVQRLGLAIENARLYEQATQAATREQIVNQIAQEVQGASTIDDVLQSALKELSTVLGASRGIVQINPRELSGNDPENGYGEG